MRRASISMNAIVAIILVVAAFLIITAVLGKVYEKIPDKHAGSACRTTNILRGNTQVGGSAGPIKFEQSSILSACKTFHRELEGNKGAIQLQIAEMTADCWWQWANGYYKDLLCDDKGFGPWGRCDQSTCYQCYTFSFSEIDGGAGVAQSFTGADFINFMRTETRYWEDPKPSADGEKPGPEDRIPVNYLDYLQYDQRGVLAIGYDKDSPSLQASSAKFRFEPNKVYSISYFEPYKDGAIFPGWVPGGGADNSDLDLAGKPGIFIQDADSSAGAEVCNIKFGYQGN